jgi:uncharacterized membrane protein
MPYNLSFAAGTRARRRLFCFISPELVNPFIDGGTDVESRAKLFGHPVHPMLIVLPLGLFIMAVVTDLAFFVTGNGTFAAVSYWNIVGGILGGLAAAIFGFIDWLAIPSGTRAKAIGLYHGAGNVVVVALFAVSASMRYSVGGYYPSLTAMLLAAAALILGAVTAWLGGELVDRLGVGVDDGAHVNAPSSLRDRSTQGRGPVGA